ncbi:crotonase/enoyl-CoA hydratase family protein [Sphingomonas lacunae]|nr:crotonase/enoyl-CoA hydratase family protein [Sphingomonas lacunae]
MSAIQWTDGNQRVSISMEDGIADVRMIRTDKMNALDPHMFAGLAAAIEYLGSLPGLRVVVLSGEGRAFCAGLDMESMASGGSDPSRKLTDRSHGIANHPQHVCWGWRELPVPVIAAAHGVALGGGFQVLSGADIRFVHPDTKLAILELKWGLVPDMAGLPLWRGIVRDDVLRELSYTARIFTGEEGKALGFVTHVSADPLAEAMALAREIAGKNPDAIRGMKRLANVAQFESAEALLMAESVEQDAIIRTPNQREAVMSVFEKRTPVYVDPVPLKQ